MKGGRCEACAGDGTIKIEMHFLPDIYVPCEVCHGARYNRDTLEITFRGKTIADVLDLSCEEALGFFAHQPPIARHLQTLVDVGLGYIRLGQPAPTLSGGEAQRVKLASELSRRSTGHTFYVLDEPTTGLHFDDVRKLLDVLSRLVDQGNTVIVIEHNLDVDQERRLDHRPRARGRATGAGRSWPRARPRRWPTTAGSYTGEVLAPLLGVKRGKAKAVPSTNGPRPRPRPGPSPAARLGHPGGQEAGRRRRGSGRKPVATAKPASRAPRRAPPPSVGRAGRPRPVARGPRGPDLGRPPARSGVAQTMASIRSRATRAHAAVSWSTVMRLRTSPSTRPSRTQARWAASMRNMVEHGHTRGSRETTVLSGVSSSSRLTRWISVPTPMTEPGGRLGHGPDDGVGRADLVGQLDHLVGALGVDHDDPVGVLGPEGVDVRRAGTAGGPSSGPSTAGGWPP